MKRKKQNKYQTNQQG